MPENSLSLINLTQHQVIVVGSSADALIALPPTAHPARVLERIVPISPIVTDGASVPCVEVHVGEHVENLPEPVKGIRYVVSRITAAAASSREDLLLPADEVRDGSGRIIGCRALGRFAKN